MNADYAYDAIDRFLRNSLDDDQYAEYSEALETVVKSVNAADTADARRYRWLREQTWGNVMCVVTKPPTSVKLGSRCPSGDLLDSAIDATMKQGETK